MPVCTVECVQFADFPASPADVVIVGAGIVGLAHAWAAVRSGRRVVVIDRDDRAVGATVRNFGHICTTAQDGIALDYALAARDRWIEAGEAAGFPVVTDGTVVLARTPAEVAVLEEFAAGRGADAALLTRDQAARRVGFDAPGVLGGVHLRQDLRVNSPSAVPALTRHLADLGVEFHFGENVLEVGEGRVRTGTGEYTAGQVVVCVGHDVDRFFPSLASEHGVVRCRLRMMEIDAPGGIRIAPGLFTGSSLLRYGGFANTDAAAAVRDELLAMVPAVIQHTINLMCTQRPDGRIVIGDSHHYERTLEPFEDEDVDRLLLEEFARLFGRDDLVVRRRWRGVYASAPEPYLVAAPADGVLAVSVTSGIGMTTAFGLADDVVARHLAIPLTTPAP
jgi:FAD dependent oxidoreductase TIGR03364